MGGSDVECTAIRAADDRSPLAIDLNSSDVLQIRVHVAETDLFDGARRILAELRPHWCAERIRYKLFTDGITNKLVGCYHRRSSAYYPPQKRNQDNSTNGAKHPLPSPTNAETLPVSNGRSADDADDEVVLIRVYGNKTDLLIDRQAETRNIIMLQRYGFAPRLYAVFENGLAYEFVPGVTLTPQSVVNGRVWPLVARHMAKMHRLAVPMDDDGERPVAMLAPKMRSFLGLVPERFSDELKEKRLRSLGLPPVQQLRADFEALHERLRMLGSPVVFSHNDLLLGNVIYEARSERVAFIDYEYAAHNYQAFDIGNHFTEFTGIDDIDYTRYPNAAFQFEWLRVYLQEFEGRASAEEVSPDAIRRLYGQVNAFALASHYFWTIWGLIQTEHSTIDFDFILFAMTRYNEFLARKDEFLALAE